MSQQRKGIHHITPGCSSHFPGSSRYCRAAAAPPGARAGWEPRVLALLRSHLQHCLTPAPQHKDLQGRHQHQAAPSSSNGFQISLLPLTPGSQEPLERQLLIYSLLQFCSVPSFNKGM